MAFAKADRGDNKGALEAVYPKNLTQRFLGPFKRGSLSSSHREEEVKGYEPLVMWSLNLFRPVQETDLHHGLRAGFHDVAGRWISRTLRWPCADSKLSGT